MLHILQLKYVLLSLNSLYRVGPGVNSDLEPCVLGNAEGDINRPLLLSNMFLGIPTLLPKVINF